LEEGICKKPGDSYVKDCQTYECMPCGGGFKIVESRTYSLSKGFVGPIREVSFKKDYIKYSLWACCEIEFAKTKCSHVFAAKIYMYIYKPGDSYVKDCQTYECMPCGGGFKIVESRK
jgi:hypothetical protein